MNRLLIFLFLFVAMPQLHAQDIHAVLAEADRLEKSMKEKKNRC